MKYDPRGHRRISIRLPGYDISQPGAYFVTVVTWQREQIFGEIAGGRMQVNDAGFLAQNEWKRLAERFPVVQLDEYVVMPNHIHGIIILNDDDVGARQEESGSTENPPLASPQQDSGQTKNPPLASPQQDSGTTENPPLASPLQNRAIPGSLGAIIGAYKSTTARLINGIRRTPGAPVWQRNYYERIIRNETEWARIRAYIQANPGRWADDRENPAGR